MVLLFGIGGLAVLAVSLWLIAFSPSGRKRAVAASMLLAVGLCAAYLLGLSPYAEMAEMQALCDTVDHPRFVGPDHPDCRAAEARVPAWITGGTGQ